MSKRGLKFIVFVQCLLFLSPTNLFLYISLFYFSNKIYIKKKKEEEEEEENINISR